MHPRPQFRDLILYRDGDKSLGGGFTMFMLATISNPAQTFTQDSSCKLGAQISMRRVGRCLVQIQPIKPWSHFKGGGKLVQNSQRLPLSILKKKEETRRGPNFRI